MQNVLDATSITAALNTRWLGRRLEVKAQTGSTSDDAVALARAGEPAGTVVVADWQSAGRGRRGRQWLAPAGSGVLLSAVLRPDLDAAAVGRVGVAGALAVADAVRGECGLAPAVKYPNDVLLAGRKLAGVLPEAHLAGSRVEWAVLGIGVNVYRSAVPPDLVARATSLEEHAPVPDRNRLIAALLTSLEARLDLAGNDPGALAAEWRALDVVLGRNVAVTFGQTRLSGFAAEVDADGRLLLRLPDGTERWLLPGDVSFRV